MKAHSITNNIQQENNNDNNKDIKLLFIMYGKDN